MRKILNLAPLLFVFSTSSFAVEDEGSPKEFFCTSVSSTSLKDLNQLNSFSVKENEINSYNIDLSDKYKGKWLILNISATWCPYCKIDMFYFLKNLKPYFNKVEQLHITSESTGGRVQSAETTSEFLRVKALSDPYTKDLNLKEIYFAHTKTSMKDASKFTDVDGELIFKGFRGYPYQMIFNPKGKLIFRGHFTSALKSDDGNYYAPFDRHYSFISALLKGECNPSLSGK